MHFRRRLETQSAIISATTLSLHHMRYFVILVVFSLALSGCQALDTKPVDDDTAPVEDRTDTTSELDALIAGKSPQEAIHVLEQKATQYGRYEAFPLLVKATEIAISIETADQVDARITRLHTRYPGSDYHVRLEILKARALLYRKQISPALKSLEKVTARATPSEMINILNIKAEIFEASGLLIDSVQTRVQLDQSLTGRPQQQQFNDQLLWNTLIAMAPEVISSHISEIPDTLSGWLELAHLTLSNSNNGTILNQELDKWVLRHPGHPATRVIIDDIKQRQIATSKHPEHIALILPLSGKLSAVGQAIRDGFMVAALETNRTLGTNIKINVYDTEGKTELAANAIQQANQAGAKLIVGPLSKDSVQLAVEDVLNKLPLLVLNKVSRDIVSATDTPLATPANKPTVFQFSLAPESEAIQAAERMSLEGHQNIMVIVPETVWGNRIYEAFATRYQELGGDILSRQKFARGAADYSVAIQQGLNLQLSKLRFNHLKASLRKDIEFTPRRRADIDGIFLAASPQEARQIKPQLRFYYADNIPVYSTSHIFSGKTQPARDKDLEGIQFCDMPWVLERTASPNALSFILGTAWPDKSARYSRFHALGADTFRLTPHLEWLQTHNNDWLAGFTGRLSIDSEGTVKRGLKWARFANGAPKIIQ